MPTYQVNVAGWNQEEKNLIHGCAYKILYERGLIPEYKINVVANGLVDFTGPTPWPITDVDLKVKIDQAILSAAQSAEAERFVQEQMMAELESNPIPKYTLAQVDSAIDSITNLADAKIFLKKQARFLIALFKSRGIL